MVRRIYVEKKPELRQEAGELFRELKSVLGISALNGVRIVNRYDVEGLDEETFSHAVQTVLSEPQTDDVFGETEFVSGFLNCTAGANPFIFAVEALPGQFDQRADSACSCIQLMTCGQRPAVRSAKVYLLAGELSEQEQEQIRQYVINPVEAREAALEVPRTLEMPWKAPPMVETVHGFTGMNETELSGMLENMGLAMDLDDLKFLQNWFRTQEQRDPTVTEIRVVDTYWSDHCRHTTFSTRIDDATLDGENLRGAYRQYLDAREEVYGTAAAQRPQTLMDIATIGAKVLKKRGILKNLDESEEINACSVHITADVDGKEQDWLLMFKNETHNHPTEIEPFGGAATCIGGCIRDPLSGRAYVYQAMRVTGCGDPRASAAETLPGKLPQRKLAQTAAAGYSSYGNQIGLATGLVSELYHPGYIAKHLELGAVVGAVPAENVVRERPQPGDQIILLGGRTGRDGIGGATGSSKSHNRESLSTMASEVQKGNAPEERKLQRLFRDKNVTRLIKRCNDFGAGGVSVAIGELAAGLEINLDAVRRKYEGLDGTELAISESQERMAVVVASENTAALIQAAERENLEAYPVAEVTAQPRMVMKWRGETIVNLSREFLDTNGAVKHITVQGREGNPNGIQKSGTEYHSLRDMAGSLRSASRRGLAERFDSTIGAGTVLMPFGGKYQRTPAQVMAALLPVLPEQETQTCSVMSWGFDPERMSANPFSGARESVIVSLAKLAAAGCDYHKAYLTFQEYFEKLGRDPSRWGKPFAALLGALEAQLGLDTAAIGGKDSMSGSFLDLDVPPTLISFAIAPAHAEQILSPEFKAAGHPVYVFGAGFTGTGEKFYADIRQTWENFHTLCEQGKVKAAWAVEHGYAEGVMQMSFGNRIGFSATADIASMEWYTPRPGAILAELTEEIPDGMQNAVRIGVTTEEETISLGGESVSITELLRLNENVLEEIYPNRTASEIQEPVPAINAASAVSAAPRVCASCPRVLIPVFPGSNCEYDSARAVLRAGLQPEIFVVNNQSAEQIISSAGRFADAMEKSQILFIPGGFSGGDEPDGSAKFITAFFRNPQVSDAVHELLKNRDGLILGICNGFQALVKLGLVPYGEIRDPDVSGPTLTYNVSGRHQSRIVRTRIASTRSPWLSRVRTGDIISVPISHGEGRFLCSGTLLEQLCANGQIATQYVDLSGQPTMDVDYNPNGSACAVEGLLSPDGRIFGKMGHAERTGPALYRNVPGNYDLHLFDAAKDYFSL